MKNNWKKRIPLFILIGIAAVFAFSGIVMLLWNAILPAVIHVTAITFWQAMGILVLSKILFGGFRKRGGHWHGNPRRAMYMWMKWKDMTDEEKAKYKEAYQQYRCGGWHKAEFAEARM